MSRQHFILINKCIYVLANDNNPGLQRKNTHAKNDICHVKVETSYVIIVFSLE